MEIKKVVYGLGGYDETKPDNNVVEIVYYSEVELAEMKAQLKAEQAKAALLEKLGITEEEAKLLLS